MLTPIRIRGRRKRPNKDTSEETGLKKIPSGRKGGRPLLSRQEMQTSSQERVNKRARLLSQTPNSTSTGPGTAGTGAETEPEVEAGAQRRKQKKRKLSRLESLTVEIIEKIFFDSLNVNLPRASVVLNAAVSSERVYRALSLLAFWDDEGGRDPGYGDGVGDGDGHGDGDRTISRILRPFEYTPLREEERAALQSTVFQCRWCTLDRILGLLPDLMNLVIQRYWVQTGINMEDDQRRALDRFLAREEDGENNTRTFEGVDSRNEGYTLSIIPLVSITVTHQETGQTETRRILSVRNFPSKLLSGNDGTGFTEEDCSFLELLRISSGFNNNTLIQQPKNKITLSRESLQTGIHTALTQQNTRALLTLLKLDEYFIRAIQHSPTPTTPWATYTLPPEHFRTAICISPQNPEPFKHLLRASAESIPDNDPEITQWAMDLSSPFGDWLLDLMMRLPRLMEIARENPVDSVFWFGGVNGRSEMGRRFLDEVARGDGGELGAWLEEVSFDVEALWQSRDR